MNARIETQGFQATDAITDYVDQCLRKSLGPFQEATHGVECFLRVTPAQAGQHSGCSARIQVRLTNGLVVHAEATTVDLYRAVRVSSRRVRRAVKRSLRRERTVSLRRARALSGLTDGGVTA